MDKKRHDKADDLYKEIISAKKRIDKIEEQKVEIAKTRNERPGQFYLHDNNGVTLKKELTEMILFQVEMTLKKELEELEKEYEKL